jgi:hypothetical protein
VKAPGGSGAVEHERFEMYLLLVLFFYIWGAEKRHRKTWVLRRRQHAGQGTPEDRFALILDAFGVSFWNIFSIFHQLRKP